MSDGQVSDGHEGKRKTEALWPIHQVNWQRSRYVYDMFYKYKKITKEVRYGTTLGSGARSLGSVSRVAGLLSLYLVCASALTHRSPLAFPNVARVNWRVCIRSTTTAF